MNWYDTLNKPFLTPPSFVFGPVWIFMYTLIFVSFVVFMSTETKQSKTPAIVLFLVQILLNFAWSPAFFYLHSIKLSFAIILLLILFVIFTILAFNRVSKISASLLIPYLLWLFFAAYLNFEIMRLNQV